jgi:hypothetical protein
MSDFPHDAKLWLFHGPGSFPTNLAAHDAQETRAAAGVTLGLVAIALADNLKKASKAYKETDEEQKDVLNQQMR